MELSFSEIERIIGDRLPASKQYPAFWSNSAHHARAWRQAGYESTRRDVLAGHIGFISTRASKDAASTSAAHAIPASEATRPRPDVLLVGCVKTKAADPAPARDLYHSAMFERRRQYAEASGKPWYILSAQHGLLEPNALIEPYDVYLAGETADYRRAWGEWVAARLARSLGPLRGCRIEVHASAAYVDAVRPPLSRLGATISEPLSGLRQGEQLAWYDRQRTAVQSESGETGMDSSEDPPEPGFLVLDGPREVGTFTFRWPDATEEFDRGWDLVAELNGRRLRVRHALAVRPAFGAERRRCVTFIDGAAVSEGVGADDYDSSRCLLSTLKSSDGKLVRPGEPVPVPFADFPLVVFSHDIDGPYTRHALAVRLHEDDITSWVGYALARQLVRREVAKPAASARKALPRLVVEPTPTSASTRAVIDALLDYGRTQAASDIGRPTFTPHPEANDLVIRDPFAFLLAVVFDQGIPAERAWRAPFELMKRLGHLDPERMAVDPEGVRAAVAQPPVLHRYREKMPRWLVETARIVRDDYEGDAARIWADEPTARELQRRLDRFPGVGQKKAAMAVEILERDLGVVVRDLHGSDVAYDVHVRRVFLRTGLAEYDDLDHMLEVARRAHPERPGAIDFPAWLVGRQWCGAGVPACPACVLNHVCPKDIRRANVVRGA